MSILLFKLNGVSDEEAYEVRELLDEHQIDYYETDAGRWGISVAALWLVDKEQLERSRALLEEYQQQRQRQYREPPLPLATRFKQAPLQHLLIIVAIAAIAYISIVPFLTLN
ncbi:DUF6164 family protein [Oceanicoccus sagamiensis]|uniref:DUF2007 domain-containing protein n=1 Tax=Oceanicoccus sagamiensis TaxID=716816 RepID=A0A1X9NLD5_9GAMM|nr:DUF6164 family protein [Oceanicoccus sagamiensis]ARN74753.1 hypothetical protein BST96_11865 [Oceanicoccus sagamiensis]